MKNSNQGVVIGIYTCFGGPSLVGTVRSIRNAKRGSEIEIIIFADGQPISKKVKNELEKLSVKVFEQKGLSSIITKISKLVALVDSGIIMLTQDDVIFNEKAIVEVEKVFLENEAVTMVGSNIVPMPGETIFESILETGSDLVRRIGSKWRGGDNYLLSNGRCLSFRVEAIKKFSFPEKIMNTDAYLYFENKRFRGVFSFAEKAIVYIKSPLTLKEHFNQSSRFQTSKTELVSYLGVEMLKNEYAIPAKVFIVEILRMLFYRPIRGTAYLVISLYTRLKSRKFTEVINPIWKMDESTKRT